MTRLDPAGWPRRAQTPAMIVLGAVWYAATIVWPFGGSPAWLFAPLFGALIWRLEGTGWREVASWTVPLAIVLLVADQLPLELGLVLSIAGLAFLAAMLFWRAAREWWLGFVAPGRYRALQGADRRIAARMAVLDGRARDAVRKHLRDRDLDAFVDRIDRLTTDATELPTEDAEWLATRDHFVAWLAATRDVAVHPPDPGDPAADVPARRREVFETARAALATGRASPLGRARSADPPAR